MGWDCVIWYCSLKLALVYSTVRMVTNRATLKFSKKNLFHCHFFHHKPQVDYLRVSSGQMQQTNQQLHPKVYVCTYYRASFKVLQTWKPINCARCKNRRLTLWSRVLEKWTVILQVKEATAFMELEALWLLQPQTMHTVGLCFED